MKKTNYLLYFDQFISEEGIVPGVVFTTDQLFGWFDNRHPDKLRHNIREQLLKKTTNYPRRITQFSKKPSEMTNEDLFFSVDPLFTRFEVYVDGKHEPPHHSDEVARENALQAKLVANPSIIEPGLRLVDQYYKVGRRFIDVLYRDSQDNFLVIELKVSRGDYTAAGQLLHYMGWVNEYLAKPAGKKTRGMLIAQYVNNDLRLALSMVENATYLEL